MGVVVRRYLKIIKLIRIITVLCVCVCVCVCLFVVFCHHVHLYRSRTSRSLLKARYYRALHACAYADTKVYICRGY